MERSNTGVVVIGGTGFIGQRLVQLLRAHGYSVKAVSRRARAGPEPGTVQYVQGDVGDSAAMMAAIEGASIVYHLAMGGGPTWADYQRDFVNGTEYVAKACLQHKVSRLIFASSTAALYLGRRGSIDQQVSADCKPQLRGMYSRGKILAEELLFNMHAQFGLPVVIMRPGIVVGCNGTFSHGGLGHWPSDTCCLGWGKGNHPVPFVLVEDVAQAFFLAKDVAGIEGMTFNLAGDVQLTAKEYIHAVAEHTHRNFRYYPQSPLKCATIAWIKWGAKMLSGRKKPQRQTLREIKSNSMLTQLDCSAAKQLLGWTPVSNMKVFIREAVESNAEPLQPGDLRAIVRTSGESA